MIRIRRIKDYPRYYISDEGGVYTLCDGGTMRHLSPRKTRSGYMKIDLHKDGIRKTFFVHRLVAEAFLRNPKGHPFVNHKDFNTANNDVRNLEYCSARYNNIYSVKRRKCSSRYIGVTWRKSDSKWEAQYHIGKKKVYLGCYSTEEDAHEAYEKAMKEFNQKQNV